MHRRNFIKNAIYLGCTGIGASLYKIVLDENNKKNFYYKSEKDLPKSIRLEACSLCQLNCPACPTRLFENQMPKNWLGYLKFEDFKKFIDRHSFIQEIELSNRGEIFLNPELDEIIKYAYQKNIKLTANTGVNLNTVTDKTLENLVKYKFRSFRISIDGATPQTYAIYRRGGNFNTVINNIKKINEFKKKYASPYPKMTYKFILFGHNEHEIEKAKKLATKLGIEIVFKKNLAPDYSPVKNKELIERQTGLRFIEKHKNKNIKNNLPSMCQPLFEKPQIDYNGILLGCCYISSKDFGVNVFKQGLLKALNSSEYIFAKHILSGHFVAKKEDIPCLYCSEYKKTSDILNI